jgi:hypothetical protein
LRNGLTKILSVIGKIVNRNTADNSDSIRQRSDILALDVAGSGMTESLDSKHSGQLASLKY